MHIHHVSTLEKNNLKRFSKDLLEFINYLDGYHSGLDTVVFSNPVAKMLWPPEQGWAVTLAQYPEINLLEDLAPKLKEFIVEGSSISSIELLLEMNKFIDDLPDNSLFLLAPGIKEPLGGIEDIVKAAKEILPVKLPENMTAAILERELDLSLTSIENHQQLLDGIVLEHRDGVLNAQRLEQETSSLQAMAELLSLLANVEKHMCKAYLIDDLLHYLQLTKAETKEVIEALEQSQYHAVRLRIEHIRQNKLELNNEEKFYMGVDLQTVKEGLFEDNNEIPMICWLRDHAQIDSLNKNLTNIEKRNNLSDDSGSPTKGNKKL